MCIRDSEKAIGWLKDGPLQYDETERPDAPPPPMRAKPCEPGGTSH